MRIMTYDPKKQKPVLCGELDNNVFVREVQPYHFMRVVGGYGIQEDAFQQLESKGCTKIIIREIVAGKEWESNIDVWKEHCHIADYGSGKQRFLGLKYMKQI